MHVVIAPNAFKNSLPADAAAEALHQGILKSGFKGTISCCPVGDGGDGTGALLCHYLDAERISCQVADPLGRPVTAAFGWVRTSATAVIELADASGLRLLKTTEYDPLIAHTKGTGQLIKAALDKKARQIILCIGGSATVDGGTGILEELGVAFKEESGNTIEQLPSGLENVYRLDISGLDSRLLNTNFIILCDVKNKLLGSNGAAAVFAPQKGATAAEVVLLEKRLAQFDKIVYETTGKKISELPFSGAAGGIAAGLSAFCNTAVVNGIDYFLELIQFEQQLKNADWVITGEGAIDRQTLEGKAPFGVAVAAKKKKIPVIGVAGAIPLTVDADLSAYFDVLLPINNAVTNLDAALKATGKNLERTGYTIGRFLMFSPISQAIDCCVKKFVF